MRNIEDAHKISLCTLIKYLQVILFFNNVKYLSIKIFIWIYNYDKMYLVCLNIFFIKINFIKI